MIMNKDKGEEFWVKGMNQIFNRTIKEVSKIKER